jgi:hypothetical protein
MTTIYLPQRRRIDVDNWPRWDTTTDYGYFHSIETFEVWRAERQEPEEWTYEEVELTTPLDPEPWRNHRTKERAAFLPRFQGKDWHWDRRGGHEPDSALYAVRGGLDPFPYEDRHPTDPEKVLKGRRRWPDMVQGRASNAVRHFAPREGFEQNEELYR